MPGQEPGNDDGDGFAVENPTIQGDLSGNRGVCRPTSSQPVPIRPDLRAFLDPEPAACASFKHVVLQCWVPIPVPMPCGYRAQRHSADEQAADELEARPCVISSGPATEARAAVIVATPLFLKMEKEQY